MMQFSWTFLKLYNLGWWTTILRNFVKSQRARIELIKQDMYFRSRKLYGRNGATEAAVCSQDVRNFESRQNGDGLRPERDLEVRPRQTRTRFVTRRKCRGSSRETLGLTSSIFFRGHVHRAEASFPGLHSQRSRLESSGYVQGDLRLLQLHQSLRLLQGPVLLIAETLQREDPELSLRRRGHVDLPSCK